MNRDGSASCSAAMSTALVQGEPYTDRNLVKGVEVAPAKRRGLHPVVLWLLNLFQCRGCVNRRKSSPKKVGNQPSRSVEERKIMRSEEDTWHTLDVMATLARERSCERLA